MHAWCNLDRFFFRWIDSFVWNGWLLTTGLPWQPTVPSFLGVVSCYPWFLGLKTFIFKGSWYHKYLNLKLPVFFSPDWKPLDLRTTKTLFGGLPKNQERIIILNINIMSELNMNKHIILSCFWGVNSPKTSFTKSFTPKKHPLLYGLWFLLARPPACRILHRTDRPRRQSDRVRRMLRMPNWHVHWRRRMLSSLP